MLDYKELDKDYVYFLAYGDHVHQLWYCISCVLDAGHARLGMSIMISIGKTVMDIWSNAHPPNSRICGLRVSSKVMAQRNTGNWDSLIIVMPQCSSTPSPWALPGCSWELLRKINLMLVTKPDMLVDRGCMILTWVVSPLLHPGLVVDLLLENVWIRHVCQRLHRLVCKTCRQCLRYCYNV